MSQIEVPRGSWEVLRHLGRFWGASWLNEGSFAADIEKQKGHAIADGFSNRIVYFGALVVYMIFLIGIASKSSQIMIGSRI